MTAQLFDTCCAASCSRVGVGVGVGVRVGVRVKVRVRARVGVGVRFMKMCCTSVHQVQRHARGEGDGYWSGSGF